MPSYLLGSREDCPNNTCIVFLRDVLLFENKFLLGTASLKHAADGIKVQLLRKNWG